MKAGTKGKTFKFTKSISNECHGHPRPPLPVPALKTSCMYVTGPITATAAQLPNSWWRLPLCDTPHAGWHRPSQYIQAKRPDLGPIPSQGRKTNHWSRDISRQQKQALFSLVSYRPFWSRLQYAKETQASRREWRALCIVPMAGRD